MFTVHCHKNVLWITNAVKTIWVDGVTQSRRGCAKQCLLRRHWPLPSDRNFPSFQRNLCNVKLNVHLTGQWTRSAKPMHGFTLTGIAATKLRPSLSGVLHRAPDAVRSRALTHGIGMKRERNSVFAQVLSFPQTCSAKMRTLCAFGAWPNLLEHRRNWLLLSLYMVRYVYNWYGNAVIACANAENVGLLP